MPRTEELTDVPKSDLAETIQDYKDAGATKVEKKKQPNGKWTVTATFPDKKGGDGGGESGDD